MAKLNLEIHVVPPSFNMPTLVGAEQSSRNGLSSIAKRRNWASREPGVILVFCILFIVGLGIIALIIYRKWMARRAKNQSFTTAE
ncbi:hypothetical protein F1880_005818 [Penicillium rolfsii]|nr:hypothetical protein F1880_005818 [Penicillium rolfsii]